MTQNTPQPIDKFEFDYDPYCREGHQKTEEFLYALRQEDSDKMVGGVTSEWCNVVEILRPLVVSLASLDHEAGITDLYFVLTDKETREKLLENEGTETLYRQNRDDWHIESVHESTEMEVVRKLIAEKIPGRHIDENKQ